MKTELTVADLIELLQTMPPDAVIIKREYDEYSTGDGWSEYHAERVNLVHRYYAENMGTCPFATEFKGATKRAAVIIE